MAFLATGVLRSLIPGIRLRDQLIPPMAEDPDPPGRVPDLHGHLTKLKYEFSGQPALTYELAITIVKIRRKIDLPKQLRRFRRIWFWHAPFLCRQLSLRWLISCADTFVDYPRSSAERALALAAVSLCTTVKLYETERSIGSSRTLGPEDTPQPEQLFDGMTTFLIGRGDLIDNLQQRVRLVCNGRSPAQRIFLEAFDRLQHHDTVYQRFLAVTR